MNELFPCSFSHLEDASEFDVAINMEDNASTEIVSPTAASLKQETLPRL
jgi:hypothetical protein